MKISTTLPCSILEKLLTVIGKLGIGIRPDLIPPIIQVTLVYHQVFIVMVMDEVDIGIRTSNFIHVTTVN